MFHESDKPTYYVEAYFSIRSLYSKDYGWPTKEAREEFTKEVTKLFRDGGWVIKKGRDDWEFSSAIKGKEELYLHPLCLSGVLSETSCTDVEERLKAARTFLCYEIVKGKIYYDMTDSEYLRKLWEKREEMRAEFLRLYQTKRRNIYRTSGVFEEMKKKYQIYRIGEDELNDIILNDVMKNMVSLLVARGELIQGKTRQGIGYRSATEKDRRAKKCA